MKKKILKSFVEILVKKLVKTEKDLKVSKHNCKVLEKNYQRVNEELRIIGGDFKEGQVHNKWLKERNKCLETFVQKAKDGFSVIYQYKQKEGYDDNGVYLKSITEQYPVAQNIGSEEDAKKIVRIYDTYSKDPNVHYIIAYPDNISNYDLLNH